MARYRRKLACSRRRDLERASAIVQGLQAGPGRRGAAIAELRLRERRALVYLANRARRRLEARGERPTKARAYAEARADGGLDLILEIETE
jgi:hypothetical protein